MAVDSPDIRPILLPKLYRSREEVAMFDFNRLLTALSARVGTTAPFQRMLEWKLLRGSHEFPGPDGGTCVNEAAVVAAGYPYRAIYRAKDLPASFSRPIAMFALCLNDTLGDELRQELLMPFVTRLAGSADASKIEMMRAELMLNRTVGGNSGAGTRTVRLPRDRATMSIASYADGAGSNRMPPARLRWFRAAPAAEVCSRARRRCRPTLAVRSAERGRVLHVLRDPAILDAAIAIGKQADATGMHVVAKRMTAAKQTSSEAAHRGEVLAA